MFNFISSLFSGSAQTPAAGEQTKTQGPGWAGQMAMGLSVGQAIGSVYSAFSSAKATKYALNKQAQIMEDNRQIAQMGAESAFRAGEAQIAQLTYKAGQRKAAQRAGFAANGVAMSGGGSYAEVLASGDIMKEIDKDTAEMNALANAWGYKRQASQYNMQSAVSALKANYTSGFGDASSNLIEHGTAVADKWYRYYGGGK